MSPRVAVLTGLVAGVATAGLLVAALFAFTPEISNLLGVGSPLAGEPSSAPSAVPSAAASRSPRPSPSAARSGPSAGASPSGAPGSAEPSEPAPDGSATPRPTVPPRSPVPGAFHVGEPAPALKLPLLGGGTINLAGLKGRPVWVNFMGTYCRPCRDEFPVMSGFQARYADSGLVILAVDVREDVATVQEFVGATGATFTVALDKDGAAQKAWGAVALPVHFWVDARGIVRDGALGGIGPDAMARSLQLILPGVTVTP